jgi:hypothetical protein
MFEGEVRRDEMRLVSSGHPFFKCVGYARFGEERCSGVIMSGYSK